MAALSWRHPDGAHVIQWTPNRSVQRHPVDLLFDAGRVEGVAQGGTVAVGTLIEGSIPGIGPYYRTFRWSLQTGAQLLPHFIPTPYARYGPIAVSGNGRVVIGSQYGYPSSGSTPVRWIDGVASSPFLPLPGGASDAGITTTNWDGSIIWGWLSRSGWWGPFDYYRWTASTGGLEIPKPLHLTSTDLLGVVPEANVFVGRGYEWTSETYESFFLTPNGSRSPTPQPTTGEFLPFYPSADFGIILGQLTVRSHVWTQALGFRPIETWVVEDLGLDTDGWEFSWATGISGDGKILTLEAIKQRPYPDGPLLGCAIILVPEPDFASTFAVGALFIFCCASRSRVAPSRRLARYLTRSGCG